MAKTEIRPGVAERVQQGFENMGEGADVGAVLNDLLSGTPVEEMTTGGTGSDGPLDAEGGDEDGVADKDSKDDED